MPVLGALHRAVRAASERDAAARCAPALLVACVALVLVNLTVAMPGMDAASMASGRTPPTARVRPREVEGPVAANALAPAQVADPPITTTTLPPSTTTTTLPPRAAAWTLDPYRGTGVWADVYDWTVGLSGGRPTVGLESIDEMAALGIQTLYIQTAHRRIDADVAEPERLLLLIARAHERGMAVVAWYLPGLVDLGVDLRRLTAAANLPVEGIGVDIESLEVADPVERSRRLVELSRALRSSIGARAMSAIIQSPVVMQVINPNYWPWFPWAEVGELYDVVQPMSYWSEREPAWRSGQRVSTEDIDRVRASTARPDMPVHVIGGIAHLISLEDVGGMVSAVQGRGAIGASLYDWSTSNAAQWDLLRILRVGG